MKMTVMFTETLSSYKTKCAGLLKLRKLKRTRISRVVKRVSEGISLLGCPWRRLSIEVKHTELVSALIVTGVALLAANSTGDWIHIINPNDPNKPTVGQIFRTWKDHEGQIWINACWYYRPEQTVHWAEKKFYADEVVKTGQYRDHHIDEVLSKCFVMFFTRYSRGRPKGVDEKKCPIYVCESRYNEIEKHFNKIKTWKSCIPDEVRGQDYELDAFEKQQVLKKLPSPILHLLPENAHEDSPLPDAKMGVENAPPIIGAVFKRRRRENVSLLLLMFYSMHCCESQVRFKV